MGIVKKVYNKAKKAIKKRYVNKKGIKLVQVAKDVMMLKNVLNPEKKRFNSLITNQTCGQLYNSGSGLVAGINLTEVTPPLAVGTGYSDRNGASVKLHSSHYRFQFRQEANTQGNMKIKIYIVAIKGTPLASSTAAFQAFGDSMFQPNPFVTGASVIDYNSQLNPDKFNTYKIVATKNVYLRQDTVSGQQTIQDVSLGIKYNKGKGHHLRWDKNTTTLMGGQLVMLIVADRGNQGGAASSGISGVADTAAETGAYYSMNRMDYFYDN